MSEHKSNPIYQTVRPFLLSCVSSCITTSIIQPIDAIKVRIQIGGGSPIAVGAQMIRSEGFLSLYRGLNAALFRQVIYGSMRLGLLDVLTTRAKQANNGRITATASTASGMVAGAVASMFGAPCDLVLIRMQTDNTLPESQRRNYRGVAHAFSSIVKNEGPRALFTGALPTVVRASAINAALAPGFQMTQQHMLDIMPDSPYVATMVASIVSAFAGSVVSLPFDAVKTRMQRSTMGQYSSAFDCARKVFAEGGVPLFYRGLVGLDAVMLLAYLNSIGSSHILLESVHMSLSIGICSI